MADNQPERDAVHKIEAALQEIHQIDGDRRWIFDDQQVRRLDDDIGPPARSWRRSCPAPCTPS